MRYMLIHAADLDLAAQSLDVVAQDAHAESAPRRLGGGAEAGMEDQRGGLAAILLQ